MAVRTTQAVVEVLRNATPAVRTTQAVVEVLRDAVPTGRSSQFVVEVLRRTAVAVAATATTAIDVGSVGGATAARLLFAAATTAFDVGLAGGASTALLVAATTTFDVGSAGGGTTALLVTATTTFDVGSVGAAAVDHFAAAATGVEFGSEGGSQNTIVRASAATVLEMRSIGRGGIIPDPPPLHTPGMWRLPLRLGQPGLGPVHALAATTTVEFAQEAGRSRGVPAAATTKVDVGSTPGFVRLGAFDVRATTTFLVRSSDSSGPPLRGYSLAAATGLDVRSAGAETRAAAAAGRSALEVGSVGGRSGVDYHVSAITGLSFGLGEESNDFPLREAASEMEVGAAAAAYLTATEVATGLVLGGLATAEVWLPWRRGPLLLEPGGGLPH